MKYSNNLDKTLEIIDDQVMKQDKNKISEELKNYVSENNEYRKNKDKKTMLK